MGIIEISIHTHILYLRVRPAVGQYIVNILDDGRH